MCVCNKDEIGNAGDEGFSMIMTSKGKKANSRYVKLRRRQDDLMLKYHRGEMSLELYQSAIGSCTIGEDKNIFGISYSYNLTILLYFY